MIYAGKTFNDDPQTAHDITAHLSVGSFVYADDFRKEGYAVVSVTGQLVALAHPDLSVPLIDGWGNNEGNLLQVTDHVSSLIHERRKVFVCCNYGVNRSVSIAAAALYLSRRRDSIEEGLATIKEIRSEANPQAGGIFTELRKVILKRKGLAHGGAPDCYGYATHLPALIQYVMRTSGPVLELGAGDFSTPVLHALCEGRRKLVTIENDEAWRAKFLHLQSDWHTFPQHAPPLDWSVVLIDSAPAALRKGQVTFLADRAEYLVIHDSEDGGYKIPWELFQYRRDFNDLTPATAVVSSRIQP